MNDFKNFEYGFQDMNEMTITLMLEDGTELFCGVDAIFPAQGKDYIALCPLGKENPTGVFLYRFLHNEDEENIQLENIEEDAEFKAVADAYNALVDDVWGDEEDYEEV